MIELIVSTYLYGAFDCVFIMSRTRFRVNLHYRQLRFIWSYSTSWPRRMKPHHTQRAEVINYIIFWNKLKSNKVHLAIIFSKHLSWITKKMKKDKNKK